MKAQADKLNVYRILLWITCLGAITVFLVYSVKRSANVTGGFMDYYSYSRIILEGDEFNLVFDKNYFERKFHSYGAPNIKGLANQIPTNALAMLPFAWMKPEIAKIFWTITSIIAFVISLRLLYSFFGVSLTEDLGLGVTTLAFLFRPCYENIYWGQVYIILLLFFCISMYGLSKKNLLLSSIPISFTILFKGYGIVPMIWFGIMRYWRVAILSIILVCGIVIITLPLFNTQTWILYYEKVVSTLGRNPTDAHVYFQTINGLMYHLFAYDKQWLPYPLIEIPKGAILIASLVLNLLLIAVVMKQSVKEELYLSYSAAIATGVVTAPLAAEYHFVLFLPLIIGLFAYTIKEYERTLRISPAQLVFYASIIIMALPLGYRHLNFLHPPLIFLAYPKLFAGIAILLYFINVTNNKKVLTDLTTK